MHQSINIEQLMIERLLKWNKYQEIIEKNKTHGYNIKRKLNLIKHIFYL